MFVSYRDVSKREYLKLYLETYSLNAPNRSKLSKTEIRIFIEVLLHNSNKPTGEYNSPFNGEGRKTILKALNNLAETTFSSNLKKLSKKGFLIPLGKKGEYAIASRFIEMLTSLLRNPKVHICYSYTIKDTDETNEKDNQ